jgi:hypothetical protein
MQPCCQIPTKDNEEENQLEAEHACCGGTHEDETILGMVWRIFLMITIEHKRWLALADRDGLGQRSSHFVDNVGSAFTGSNHQHP